MAQFTPPDPQNPLAQLLPLLQLRESMRDREVQTERMKKADEQEALSAYMKALEADPNVNLDNLSTIFPQVNVTQMRGLKELQKSRKRSLEMAQQATPIASLASQPGSGVGPNPGVMNQQIAQNLSQSIQRMIVENQDRPEEAGRILGAALQGGASQRLEEEGKTSRERAVRLEDSDVDAFATRIMGVRAGVLPQDHAQEVLGEINQRFGERATEVTSRVYNESLRKFVDNAAQQRIARSGRADTEFEMAVSAAHDLLGLSRSEAILYARNDGKLDPITGQFVPSVGQEWLNSRFELSKAIDLVSDLAPKFEDAVEEAAQGGAFAGPVLGSEKIRSVARWLALDTPAVAVYEQHSRMFVNSLLKSTQGSRPTDYDLRYYLELMPLMTEITVGPDGKPNKVAVARIESMGDLIRRAAQTPNDRARAIRARKMRAIPETKEDIAIKNATRAFAENKISLSEFEEARSRWSRTRGHLFRDEEIEKSVKSGNAARAVDAWEASR